MTAGGPTPETASSYSVEDLQIRPIGPEDKLALAEGFERLSDESRYRRFLAPRGSLSDAELRYLTVVEGRRRQLISRLLRGIATGDLKAFPVRNEPD